MSDSKNGVERILPNSWGFGRPARMPQLSVVIPAYNEADRIGPYLAEIRAYLDAEYPRDTEVLVVDDGSRDATADLVEDAAGNWPELFLIRLERNRGKGAAVRAGVLEARGRRVLFADADGATPIAEERRLSRAIANGAGVAIGSRYVSGPGVTRERNFRREAASLVFRTAARLLVGVGVKDTQCGFKLFEAETAKRLFGISVEDGYLFDIEVLALAQRSEIEVREVAVNWSEKPGSKVRFVRDSLKMFAGLWRLRRQLKHMPITTPTKKSRAA
jgi:dolichyl-phosphate beta-glucosyltransferase